jgi:tetratricopeptide (TPR) repeat protein
MSADWTQAKVVVRMGRWALVFSLTAILGAHLFAFDEDQLKTLVQKAFDLHQKGQFVEALPLLKRAYAIHPDEYIVCLLLGIDSLRTGQIPSSILYLKKASRIRPHEEYPLAYLGEAYAQQHSYAEASEAYLKATRVDPGSTEAAVAFVDFSLSRFAEISAFLRGSKKGLAAEYRLRAMALEEKEPERAALLQRSADLDPDSPGIWSELSKAAMLAGDLKLAREDLDRALQADSYDLLAWLVDARLNAQAGEWKQATDRLNGVARHSPGTLMRASDGWPAQLQPPGKVLGAAAKFFACIRENATVCDLPEPAKPSAVPAQGLFREHKWEELTKTPAPALSNTEAWRQRGVGFASLYDCPQAIPALERGRTKSAGDVYGLMLLSWCYSREAGRTADEVKQSSHDDVPVLIMRGDILLRLQGKADLAVGVYEQALARAPQDPSVLERLAEACFGAGQTEAAKKNADAALEIDPQRIGAKRTLAKIALQERDYTTALPYLRELAANNPEDTTGLVELGKACAQTGELEEARRNLEPALKHGYPDEKGSLHYLLGTVLKKLGHATEANQAFVTAAQLSEAFQHKSYRDQDIDAQP